MRKNILSDERRAERAMLAVALADSPHEVEQIIEARFGYDSMRTKAALPAIQSSDINVGNGMAAAFAPHLARNAVVAALAERMFRVDFASRFNSPFSATGEFIPEHHAVSVSNDALTSYTLPSRKVSSIVVMSRESLEAENAEDALAAAMAEAVGTAMDEAFLDVDLQKTDTPTPITVSAPSVTASDNPAESFRAFLRNFSSWTNLALVMHPETAVAANLYPYSPFLDLGADGGRVAGIRVVTSESAPFDSTGGTVIGIDASRIAVALEGVQVQRSEATSLTLDDSIDSNGTSDEMISLWQSNNVALKATIAANWQKMDDNAVRTLTGCGW